MRSLVYLAAIVLSSACTSERPTPASTTADTVGVRAAFDSLDAAVKRLDARGTLALYDTSSAFVHVFDGNVVRSRPAYDALVPSIYGGLRTIDSHIDSVFVVPLGPGTAAVVAAFHETVTDTAGRKSAARGTWTNVFVKRDGGWRIAAAHSSHVPMPTK
jgi:uncharacterized protein (TIGR02246 family)